MEGLSSAVLVPIWCQHGGLVAFVPCRAWRTDGGAIGRRLEALSLQGTCAWEDELVSEASQLVPCIQVLGKLDVICFFGERGCLPLSKLAHEIFCIHFGMPRGFCQWQK